MATDKVLMAWLQKLTQVRPSSAATGYPAANVLDLDDLSEPWRSTDLTGEWLEFVAGQQVIGESVGLPESGAPVATITRVKIDPSGRYVFAIENGVLRVWPWDNRTGEFGARLTARSGSTLTADNDFDVIELKGVTYAIIAGNRSSGLGYEIYPLDVALGQWGSRFSDGVGTSANGTLVRWVTQDGTGAWFCIVHSGPLLRVQSFNEFGSNTSSAPASEPSSTPNGIDISAAITGTTHLVALALSSSPRVEIWPVDASGLGSLGAKFANPGTLPAGTGRSVAFSNAIWSSNAYVAVGHDTTPFLSVYPCSSSAFGAKLTNPASLPAASGRGVAFRRGDTFLAVGQDNASSPIVYAFTPTGGGAIGAKHSMFNPPAASGGRAVAFSPDGKFLLAGHSTDPFLLTLPFAPAVVQASIGVVFLRWSNATAAATIRCRLGTDASFVSNAFDSGVDPAFPSGVTDDTLTVYAPNIWIIPPSAATAEYMRLDFVDADNPDGFMEIGAVFAAPIFQPEVNMGYGWTNAIDDLTRSSESESGHIVRQPRAKRRTLQLRLGFATETEALDALHALLMLGSEQHVVVLPKPNEATGKMNFQLGIFGHLVAERRIANPYHGRYEVTLTFMEALP